MRTVNEIDHMLFGIQGCLDMIADNIYNQNAIRSREIKEQGFMIGCARQHLKEAAQGIAKSSAQQAAAVKPEAGPSGEPAGAN